MVTKVRSAASRERARKPLKRCALALQRRSNSAKVQVSGPQRAQKHASVAADGVLNHSGQMGGHPSVVRAVGGRRYSGSVSVPPQVLRVPTGSSRTPTNKG